ncbi:DUF4344 domain-containing metallopeptidase [Pontivivens ytuae]|uniref:Metallopeptidase DUF4344 n=1 Tax=Pontivivens ytuae TaxID=2789856 RepID=A0A7S9LPS3_9RHOB|nr:DUF4344 domain-containing metallopeptidase [Pontivivens ytuae]QPH53034.1 hypothetical protein I0K15_14665 [Pontivivens ytuae]
MRFIVSFLALLAALPTAAQDRMLSGTKRALTHIIAHEIGHALIREFDLPILGNEEVMADTFATIALHEATPNRIEEIILARVAAWRAENDAEQLYAEHPSDARRAAQAMCLLYGLDPDRFEPAARADGMTGEEAADCRDRVPEIARAWRRIVAPLRMPEGSRVTEVRVIVGEGPWEQALRRSRLPDTMEDLLAAFDWHSQITLHFDHCEGGASWSRNSRTILVCDDLIERLEGLSTP